MSQGSLQVIPIHNTHTHTRARKTGTGSHSVVTWCRGREEPAPHHKDVRCELRAPSRGLPFPGMGMIFTHLEVYSTHTSSNSTLHCL